MKLHIQDTYDVYREYTELFSMLGRLIILIIFIGAIFTHDILLIRLSAGYFLIDGSQYFIASLSYAILAILQAKKKVTENRHPAWVNYGATLAYNLKYLVLVSILILIILG